MEKLQEKELKLLEDAGAVFMRYGIKSVNMDDMARHLGISKKTLYRYVKDKEDLVNKVIDIFLAKENAHVKEILKQKLNAIDENLEIVKWVNDILQNLHPSVMYDLDKYHPEAAKRMRTCQEQSITESIVVNLKKGQKEGLYRKDFNSEIIAILHVTRIDSLLNRTNALLAEVSLKDLYREIFNYHIHGVASPKGLEYLQEKMKSIKL